MYYEDLEIGMTASSFKIISDIDFAGASPHMLAASHAERLLTTKVPGPDCTLLAFYASFASEPKVPDQLETAMQGARQLGMITMDSSLRDLFDKSQITGEQAFHAANDKRKFEPYKTMT